MEIVLLIAAFGAGILAASMGAIVAFVFAGLTVISAVFGGAAGEPAIGLISFGSMFGPHIAFAGAAAAAAYAKTQNHLQDGQDVVTPLIKFGDPKVLLVGGVFGALGFVIQYLIGAFLGPILFEDFLGDGAAQWTDTVAFTVVLSGVIARLVFGKTGLVGKTPTGEKREWISTGKRLGFILTYGGGIGILIGGIVAALGKSGLVDGNAAATAMFSSAPVIGFGVAAVTLSLLMCDKPVEAFHHIILPAGTTAVIIFTATQNGIVSIIGAIIMGLAAAFVGEWAGKIFNSHADTHIDPPAVAIFILQAINTLVLGGLIFV